MTASTPRRPLLLAIPYAVYATAVFLVLALVILLLLFLIPGLGQRRWLAHSGSRAALWLMGMRVVVLNEERLPLGPCVVVANHASYIDGVVMNAALPPRFAFVIKREMDAVPLANLLLRRIGAEFIDRGRGGRGARDARRLLKAARSPVSMVFFPEGTFEPEPGLLRFHAGAFVFADRANLPVIPVALRGTRSALPSHPPLPWPTRIEVEILPLIERIDAPDEERVQRTRDLAREAILARAGEPDRAAK